MNTVMTVLGEISPQAMGITDAHNHVWIDPVPGCGSGAPVLNNQDAILSELQAYLRSGGSTILDCQPAGCGRNTNRLAALSKISGVNIVACTGFHRATYYHPDYWLWRANTDAIARHLIQEIRSGTQESQHAEASVKAGFIKIACEETLQKTYRPALEAAACAAAETGLMLEIHTEKGAEAEVIAAFLMERKVKAGQIVICHIDKRPDPGVHRALAQSGIFLEYDTFYRPKYQPEKNLWPLIIAMVNAGLEQQVILATDMAEAALWSNLGGGPGLANFPLAIRQQLFDKGLDANCVNNLMGANISRCLAQL